MQPWNYRHLLASPSSPLRRDCTLHDAARGDATAELRYERCGEGGSIILWDASSAYEVTHDRRKGRYALVGKDQKETLATARAGGGRGECRVVLEMGGGKWEVVRRRGRLKKSWDVFRLGSGEGERVAKGGSEANEIGEDGVGAREEGGEEAVGELTSRGVRNRRYVVYVRREVPLEVVAFAMWIGRSRSAGKEGRKEEHGCVGKARRKLCL